MDAITQVITTVAGSGLFVPGPPGGGDGGPATSATLSSPNGVGIMPDGDILITESSSNRLRRVDRATGIISTFAGGGAVSPSVEGPATSISLDTPLSLKVDASGTVYIGTSSRLCRVDVSGVLSTIAGTGVAGPGPASGPGTSVALDNVQGIDVTPDGQALYFCDVFNNRVRRLDLTTGFVTTVAGTGTPGFGGDGGPAAAAQMTRQRGAAFHCTGEFLFSDNGNRRVRKIRLDGTIVTVAGSDNIGDNGPLTGGRITLIRSLHGDAQGNLYVTDSFRIRRVDRDGVIATIVGNGEEGPAPDGAVAAASPSLLPFSVTADDAGNVYFSEIRTNPSLGVPIVRIRKVDAAGILSTVAGQPTGMGFSPDGTPAAQALLQSPQDIDIDPQGHLYYYDQTFGRVRRIDASTGLISTVMGGGSGAIIEGAVASQVALGGTVNIAAGTQGDVYVSVFNNRQVYRVDASGILHVIAGVFGVFGYSGDGGPALQAKLNRNLGLDVDGAGNVYVADSVNHAIRRIDAATGVMSRFAGAAPDFSEFAFGLGTPGASGDGGQATDALLSDPNDVWVDSLGNVYIADRGNLRIRRIASGTATSVLAVTDGTGTATSPAYVTGPAGCQTVTATAPGVLVGALTFDIRGTDPAPAAPDPFLIAEANASHVSLVWNVVDEPDVVGYRVYRGAVSGGPYPTMLTPQPIADNSFVDTQVAPGLDYFYVVTAVDACGEESPFSVEAHARPRDIATPTVITSPPEGFETTDPFLTVSGTAEPGATVTVYSTDAETGEITELGAVTADAGGNFAAAVLLTTSGAQAITAIAVDAFGNTGVLSAPVNILADILLPPIGDFSRCVTVDPPCAKTPEPGETPQTITFTYTMVAPPNQPKYFGIALSADAAASFVDLVFVPGGVTVVRTRPITADSVDARLHPAAWCKSFPRPMRGNAQPLYAQWPGPSLQYSIILTSRRASDRVPP
ncbi:MAG: hypothetical protein HYY93_04850 [Planctomycetes bacterium]|nr:hypothetical protein [Planctomycetota bacterium]